MLAAVGCRLLKNRDTEGFPLTTLTCVTSGEVNCTASKVFCDVRRSNGRNVINVGGEAVLP